MYEPLQTRNAKNPPLNRPPPPQIEAPQGACTQKLPPNTK